MSLQGERKEVFGLIFQLFSGYMWPMTKKDIFGDEIKEKTLDTVTFAELFEGSAGGSTQRKVGDRFTGQVLSMGKTELFVSTGSPIDGVIPLREVLGQDGQPKFKVGDEIPVQVIRMREGEIFLKYADGVGSAADVESLGDAYDMELPIEGKVLEVVKGGFRVQVMGKTCFCPLSQMDSQRIDDPQKYLNNKYEFIITQFDEKGRNIVISRRKLLDLKKTEMEGAFLQTAKIGELFRGEITRLENFGAFVKIVDGPEGLIPISELAWGRIKHPSEVVRSGEIVMTKLLKAEEDQVSGRMRISLSLKQAGGESDPWLRVMTKYSVGTQHKATVEKKENFGIFVQLEPGVTGLLPRSKWKDSVDGQQFENKKKGDAVYVRIEQIEYETKRMTLSVPIEGEEFDYVQAAPQKSLGTLGDLFKNLKK